MPKGQPHRLRVDHEGRVYRWRGPARYERLSRRPPGQIPVSLKNTEVMVRHPQGHFVRTHRCVLEVDCPVERCKRKAGQLCRGVFDSVCGTHYRRRDALRAKENR